MIEQVVIAVAGVAAAVMSQARGFKVRRWACIAGLVAQPAWYVATWQAGQWGMFVLSLVYTAAWCLGVWNYWLKQERERS